jgi:hypothetical protein
MAAAVPASTLDRTGRRRAPWPALLAAGVVGVLALVAQSWFYHLHKPTDGSVAQDLPVYVVSGVLAVAIAGIGLLRVSRSSSDASGPRVGVVLAVLGLVIFPVAYYTPMTFVWGATSFLLSRNAPAGKLRTAGLVLGVLAMCCTLVVVVLRAVGVTYQAGG